MSNFPETADIETSSDDYATRFTGPAGKWLLTVQEKITIKLTTQTQTILDVGGGHGQLAIPLCKAKHSVTVLGSDESCAKRINSVIAEGNCKFDIGNIIDLPYPDKSFDTVISFRLLAHCKAWDVLIKELCRTAKHSVIVDYPTSQSLNKIAPALFSAKKKMEGNTRPFRLFSHKEIVSEFEKNGFIMQKRIGEFFIPMVVHRVIKCPAISKSAEFICRSLGLTKLWGSPVIAKFIRKD